MVKRYLEHKLGYSFSKPEVLKHALTHRSYGSPNNERLEFLGDSVLNFCIALELYQRFPKLSEGELSRVRATLVNQQSLFEVAQALQLGDQLLLGEGELKSGGFRRPSILADAVEAVLGAIFLDSSFERVKLVIGKLFEPLLNDLNPQALIKDAKTLLQEYLQARKLSLPKYNVIATSGEAHEQLFKVECVISELKVRTVGEGKSRRGAEQSAAKLAYELATST